MTLSSHCSDATWEAEIYSLLPGRNSSLHSPAELVITTELGEEGRPLSRCSDNIWLLRGILLLLGSWEDVWLPVKVTLSGWMLSTLSADFAVFSALQVLKWTRHAILEFRTRCHHLCNGNMPAFIPQTHGCSILQETHRTLS